jgi:ribosomal protein S18 acetylase RimI-like enzyme
MKVDPQIRPITQEDQIWIVRKLTENWGSPLIIRRGESKALQAGCSRLWLITTNDNLIALKFYQKRGFQLIAVHPDALAESRKIKPSIPQFGMHGIPLRDEIELHMILK